MQFRSSKIKKCIALKLSLRAPNSRVKLILNLIRYLTLHAKGIGLAYADPDADKYVLSGAEFQL